MRIIGTKTSVKGYFREKLLTHTSVLEQKLICLVDGLASEGFLSLTVCFGLVVLALREALNVDEPS